MSGGRSRRKHIAQTNKKQPEQIQYLFGLLLLSVYSLE